MVRTPGAQHWPAVARGAGLRSARGGTISQLDPNADLERSVELYRAAISEFQAAGQCAHNAYNNLGGECMARGTYEQAAELYRQAVQEMTNHLCPDNGGLPWLPRGNLGFALIELGRLDEARAELDLGATEAASAGWEMTGIADIGLAELLRREGNVTGARELLLNRASLLESSDLKHAYDAAWVNADLARIELALGLTDVARGHVRRSLVTYSRIISINDVCDALAVAAAVSEAHSDWRTSASILGGLVSWTTERGLVLRADSMELIDRTAAQQRSALTAGEFEAAWNAGTGASVADMSDHFLAAVSTSEG